MSATFLLDTLACMLWIAWTAFVLDVTHTIADEIRSLSRPVMPRTGPLNALAALLVGAIILTLPTQRPVWPALPPASRATPTLFESKPVTLDRPAILWTREQRLMAGTVEVEPPHNGVYDSLWRIADRTLGDGARWPQIYALNKGRRQPDGRTLANPNLIRPGWILRLPDRSSVPDTRPSSPSAPDSPHSPGSSSFPPTSTSPPGNGPTASSSPSRPAHDEHGFDLPTGAFVGFGLAALITAALLTVQRRRRVRYRPGSGERHDLTIAPVVRALRLAHDDLNRADSPSAAPDEDDASLRSRSEPLQDPPRVGADVAEVGRSLPKGLPARVIGVREGQALAWDLARTRGLGLVGPGAPDAVRALLVALLAEDQQPSARTVEVVVPASDARTLIGDHAGHPAGLRIVDDLDAALDVLEGELLVRTTADPDPTSSLVVDLVLIATPAPHVERRLQSVLDNGSTLGLAGILTGQWRPGGTARIRADGTVAAASPSVADLLTDVRLFALPADDAQALLDLLHEARPSQRSSGEGRSTGQSSAPVARDLDRGVVDLSVAESTADGPRDGRSTPSSNDLLPPADPPPSVPGDGPMNRPGFGRDLRLW
ncbi:LysM peptidoglycan-binding domain-containing protein [Streptomyces sp. NPDC048282]|uniref:LysM peptidoglycan-binding domain-containing protein n=1 Tax=Streptomyces sp. NPDC048282 TaxID=3365528 RepID=UPI003713BD27